MPARRNADMHFGTDYAESTDAEANLIEEPEAPPDIRTNGRTVLAPMANS